MKISGFVVSYNRQELIETCLRSIRFVDELIVLDKSSTDETPDIAAMIADKVIKVPWSPTVEATRQLALMHCTYDNIVFLDDDECFSVNAIEYLDKNLRDGKLDLYSIPCRQHILGRHDESAYYWPERHFRAFRRGYLHFGSTVHAGVRPERTTKIANPDPSTGICYHNISHANASVWIEKTNRYTSISDRTGSVTPSSADLILRARGIFEAWVNRVESSTSQYAKAVLLLRMIYDLVDAIKYWEQNEGIDGNEQFQEFCRKMNNEYDNFEINTGINTSMRA